MHVSTKHSSHALWRTLPLGSVSITGGLWSKRQQVNRQVSLRHGYQQLERSGNLNNLRLAAGGGEGEYRPPLFMDSDVYKWLEAVAYDLAIVRDSQLEKLADQATDLVVAAQQPDGYLNSYYQVVQHGKRWADLDHGHEMYCAGHLFEAAVAMHRATGNARLLEVARRFADCIATVFGPGKRQAACGHPEIELALVELYRETGERRYLDLAGFFVDQRGHQTMGRSGRYFGPEYHQDRVPVRQATVVEGHAVRQLYLTTGATDLYLETGDQALLAAMERLWQDMTAHKMHINGGFGARYTGEAFGQAYELPADRCYCETCAAIAAMMWNWRMLLATGQPRFADLFERSLYNGFLSGVSLDGQRYFYVNPLQSRGGISRPEWYGCACCPPNVMRQIAMLGHCAATTAEAGIQIHQYMPATIRVSGGGPQVALRLETDYPWDGQVRATVEETDGRGWELALRIPAWAGPASVVVNGAAVHTAVPGNSYATIQRVWQAGDVVALGLSMTPRLTEANPRVDAVRDCLCLERGPVLYCLEEADQAPGVDLLDVRLAHNAGLAVAWRADLLDGVATIQAAGQVVDMTGWEGQLYRPASEPRFSYRGATLTAVPYYAWANRGPGTMRVWIPRR